MLRLVLAGSVAVLTVLMAVACGGGGLPHINRGLKMAAVGLRSRLRPHQPWPGQQRQL